MYITYFFHTKIYFFTEVNMHGEGAIWVQIEKENVNSWLLCRVFSEKLPNIKHEHYKNVCVSIVKGL